MKTKGTPTGLNAWTLRDVLEHHAVDGVFCFIPPTSVAGIRRVLKAGWLEPAPGKPRCWQLSPLGKTELAKHSKV